MIGIQQAIHAIGSQAKLAKALGCTQQNVSTWLKTGHVPTKWIRAVEQATGIHRSALIDPALSDLLSPVDI